MRPEDDCHEYCSRIQYSGVNPRKTRTRAEQVRQDTPYRRMLPGTTERNPASSLKSLMAKRRQAPTTMERRQPGNKDRSNQADRGNTPRQARERRSGEGSDSALAKWKSIERDREKSRPRER